MRIGPLLCFFFGTASHAFTIPSHVRKWRRLKEASSSSGFREDIDANKAEQNTSNRTPKENESAEVSTIRIDDGGSDLSQRFKYKVNALMGVFDPPPDQDNERVSGHILNAMLKFPTRYTFHVVGRGNATDFSNEVRQVLERETGDANLVVHVTPRGSKFTKIMIEAQVFNANMITTVYKRLENLEQTVMRF